MEQVQALYVFDIVGAPYDYIGDKLTEVSVFAESAPEALSIIGKEMGADLLYKLRFNTKTYVKLYGPKPHRREVTFKDS